MSLKQAQRRFQKFHENHIKRKTKETQKREKNNRDFEVTHDEARHEKSALEKDREENF